MTAQLRSWVQALAGEASGNSVMAPGPGHSPHDRSLSVTLDANAPDGFLVHSFAGDDPIACKDYVRAKLGLPAFQPQAKMRKRERAQQPKKTYFDYHAESGAVVYQVARTDYYDGRKKTFSLRRPNPDRPGGWISGPGCMAVVPRVPYRLPELIEALANGSLIAIAEGECEADLLRGWNIPATCNSEGHGSVKNWADHARYFKPGDQILILPDNDPAGRNHACAVGAYLTEIGASVRVLDLPGLPQKGDVIDWAAAGGTAGQLHALIENNARPWAPTERESVNANPNGAMTATAPGPQVITRRASDIAPEPIDWLWKYWLARGKLHIIGGVPETGKTTIALAYAAIVSSCGTWPDGTRAAVGNVLIWTSEDDPADTLVPRLIRMGADLSRIYFIEQAILPGAKARPFNPAIDMPALVEKAAAIGDVALLILDPVVAAMPITRNSHNNAETRNGMQPVVDFSKASDIAVMGIGHLTKGAAGKDPLERLNGSGAFGALPRIVMGAAKNEAEGDGEPERIMVRIKSNIGPRGGGFGYHIDMATLHENPAIEATRIVWERELEGTARELLNAAEGETEKVSKLDEAKSFLRAALSKSARPMTEVKKEAAAQNIKWGTLERASKEDDVIKQKDGIGGWIWKLS